VTAATSSSKDAAHRLPPVAFGDPCPSSPLRSFLEAGRDEATVPSVELSNWSWQSRAAGGRSPKADVAARYYSGQVISAARCSCEVA
jgi:hypothetical protein